MTTILFATGNTEKFEIAQTLCSRHGIQLTQFGAESHEIQSEDPVEVITQKAKDKFALSGSKPLVVSDDSWDIPGLHGFPGPYMKSMDVWLSSQDFLNLTKSLQDRRILLHQYLAYIDANTTQLFHTIIPGTLSQEIRGNYGKPAQKIIMLDRDNGRTISEVYDNNLQHNLDRFNPKTDPWEKFVAWYQERSRND